MSKEIKRPAKQESFVGNVMKYSVATYLGFLISGAALIIKGVLPPDAYGVPATFMAYTMSLMNLGMLGLDQALLRFYHEPTRGVSGRQMFLACVKLSVLVMVLAGAVASVFFAPPLAVAFGLGQGGAALVPFLFLNAALYMLVRYINVLLRLENDVRAYTVQTLWMNACLNLIYLLPGFFTSNTWAFIGAALAGFGGVAIAFWFRALRLARTEPGNSRGCRRRLQCSRQNRRQTIPQGPCRRCLHLPHFFALRHRPGPGGHPDAALPLPLPVLSGNGLGRGGAGVV